MVRAICTYGRWSTEPAHLPNGRDWYPERARRTGNTDSVRFLGRTAVVAFAAALASAAGAADLVRSQPASSRPLTPLAKAQLVKCRASRFLAPACIRRVPRVAGSYRAYRTRDGHVEPELQIFDLERYSQPLRPPTGAHITVAAGAVWRLTPFRDPDQASTVMRLSDAIRERARSRPVSFGYRRWNGLRGVLYLAPPYLHGGQLGDHLVFQWGRADRMYVVSLHTWAPLAETAATLRAMVETLP